jgi:hypothetical protein
VTWGPGDRQVAQVCPVSGLGEEDGFQTRAREVDPNASLAEPL